MKSSDVNTATQEWDSENKKKKCELLYHLSIWTLSIAEIYRLWKSWLISLYWTID